MSLAYLIEGQEGLILVDAGLPGDERRVLNQMQALNRDDLRLIFITHAHLDHYGSAAALRQLTGAPIAIHQDDGEAMAGGRTRLGTARGLARIVGACLPVLESLRKPEPTLADLFLNDGDSLSDFGLEAAVLHTPGHTVGSSSLLVEERLAFVGDLLTTTGRPHLQRNFAQDWSLIPQSFDRLMARRPEWVYPGHGRLPASAVELQDLATGKSL
jgi:glyoxylase-like metal-dependent hydrolase (beta-lactamase superfamily II)